MAPVWLLRAAVPRGVAGTRATSALKKGRRSGEDLHLRGALFSRSGPTLSRESGFSGAICRALRALQDAFMGRQRRNAQLTAWLYDKCASVCAVSAKSVTERPKNPAELPRKRPEQIGMESHSALSTNSIAQCCGSPGFVPDTSTYC
jgi:hypothetical protein